MASYKQVFNGKEYVALSHTATRSNIKIIILIQWTENKTENKNKQNFLPVQTYVIYVLSYVLMTRRADLVEFYIYIISHNKYYLNDLFFLLKNLNDLNLQKNETVMADQYDLIIFFSFWTSFYKFLYLWDIGEIIKTNLFCFFFLSNKLVLFVSINNRIIGNNKT